MRTFKQLLLSSVFVLPSVMSMPSAHAETPPLNTTSNLANIAVNGNDQVAVSKTDLPPPLPEVEAITAKNLYQVELADIKERSNAALSEAELIPLSEKGMKKLLVRLTGKHALLQSPRTALLLTKARNWLRSYSYVPIVQEGVMVGQKLRLYFDEVALKAALAEEQIKIWPLNLRPRLLLMGTLVENSSVTKLDQEALQYRVDINLRQQFADMALTVETPQGTSPWIYPMNPANNIGALQDLLVQTDLDKLLSYKLVKRADGYELSWYLFSENGTVLAKGKAEDTRRNNLMNDMVNLVLSRLVELNREVLEINDQVVINLTNINDLKSIEQAKTQLQENLPTLTELRLVSVKEHLAQLEIAFRGDYSNLMQWLANLPQFKVLRSSEMLRQIDVNFIYVEPKVEQLIDPETGAYIGSTNSDNEQMAQPTN